MYENDISVDTLEKCAKILANNLPGYFCYDLSMKAIKRVIEDEAQYPIRMFTLDKENKIHYSGAWINLRECNACYIKEISEKIPEIVNGFFKYRLFEKDIIRLDSVHW